MENYELIIDKGPCFNRVNGRFLKGHEPFNKGIPMKEWMDGRKIPKVKKYLELGRKQGNKRLAGSNQIPIVGIKGGKLYPFDSSEIAAKILKSKGIRINARNIRSVCLQRICKAGKYHYTRKTAGGFRWFPADLPEKYMNLIIKP